MTLENNYLLIKMEIATPDEDTDPPILIDSGTESINDSPIADENLQSPNEIEQTVIWDIGAERRQRNVKNILDKSISVDEDSLIKPLEPIIANNIHSNKVKNDFIEEPSLISILKSNYLSNHGIKLLSERKVSFPNDLDVLASYKEPDIFIPFNLNESFSSEEILFKYQSSCKKHNTIELDSLKNQILDIKNNTNHSATLNLASINITMEVCETLEDLFKITNFRRISIKDSTFTAESRREFINILEYYDCCLELISSDHFTKELEAWKLFCNMTSKCNALESLSLEGFDMADINIKVLCNNIKLNHVLKTLKFHNCNFVVTPTNHLVDALICNSSIQELYMPQTGLYTKEADLLGKLLSKNQSLKVLDISNNQIGDRGMEVLAKGLCNQTAEGYGLSVLVIFNNQITEKSGPVISNIITECKNLHTLNIGFNNLTDEVLIKIEESLEKTISLEGLGLQSTLLTDKGVSTLANAIQKNNSLQKINLKGNKAIQTEGLEQLSHALTNSKITRVVLDETNRYCDDPQAFMELVKKINAICTVNKSKAEQSTDDEVLSLSMYFSRKVSLSCEPIYTPPRLEPVNNTRKKSPSPSPIPSPGYSPTPRSRFSVTRVQDTFSSPISMTPTTHSRFQVIPVLLADCGGSGDSLASSPPPDEYDDVRQFANVRSSVSSIDSVDSLSTRDSMYDSATPSGESD